MIDLRNVSKTFTLHNQGSAVIEVINNVSFSVGLGECVALTGASGAGKSTLMRMIYGNYLTQAGQILIDGTDVVQAEPRDVIALRRETLGYVSQFLRVVPRVPTLDVVAEPLRTVGAKAEIAQARAEELLTKLNIPQRLWSLSPTTFSGGEQQRVNIARGFAHTYPAMLLDEPTASLDAANRDVVLSLIEEAKARGAAIIGIFHDEAARSRVCDREIDVGQFTPGLSSSSAALGQPKVSSSSTAAGQSKETAA
ncbi:phosphonate C-P lyase system protein PhnL [Ascidiaceihabitans sp.]|uniref:phosphonate C-P lyase system protein PhnL n=1 Tax=Ascidiaceihabitans sp. TaxID=1872644 RepID=UPI00329768AC